MDFNDYVKNTKDTGNPSGNGGTQGIFGLVNSLATKFDGKSQKELLEAIYKEAERGKRNGTLTNKDIDNFVSLLSPVIDERKRKYLKRIAEELKKI